METKWKPQGNIVAQGIDGVPWELYDNGYLLFRPKKGKKMLANSEVGPSWKREYGQEIFAIGFTEMVYAPKDSSGLFSQHNIFDSTLPYVEYIEASKIDVSKVTNMSYMFANLTFLVDLDVSDWDTSKVTDMTGMFEGVESLPYIDVSKWNTTSLEDVCNMFLRASSLICLDFSGWKMEQNLYFPAVCEKCTSLQKVTFPQMTFRNCNSTFQDCWNLETIDFGYSSLVFEYISIENMLPKYNNLKLLDFSKMKNDAKEIKQFLNMLLEDGLQLNEDCVVKLPA